MGKTKAANIDKTAEKTLSGAEKYAAKKAAKENTGTEATPQETKKKQEKKIRGKKYVKIAGLVSKNSDYTISDAIDLVKKTSYSKFDGSVELHLTVRKEGLSVNIALPHSTGRQKRIEFATDATIEKLKTGKIDFDVLISTAEMMPKLVAFAKLLGPKGLMPNPKNGTIVKDESQAAKFGSDTVNVKTEKKAPLIHTIAGKVSMSETDLKENIEAILSGIGARQILKAYIKATMGPSIRVKLD